MKNNIYIQEIEKLNSKISIYNLVDKYIIGHITIGVLMFIIPYVLFWVCFWRNYYILGGIFFIIMIFLVFLSIRYIDRKRLMIIQQKYSYALQEEKFILIRVFSEIQKQELINKIDNKKIFDKENLLFLIESLKSKINENRYLYTLTLNAIIVFFSVLLVLLSGYLNFIETFEVFEQVAKIVIGIASIILVTTIYIDFYLKDWKLNKYKNQNRIIRTLENIYLEITNN